MPVTVQYTVLKDKTFSQNNSRGIGISYQFDWIKDQFCSTRALKTEEEKDLQCKPPIS